MKKKIGIVFGILIILLLAYSLWNYYSKPDESRECCGILKDWVMKNI